MDLKTPAFWYRDQTTPPPLTEKLLSPLSCLYAAGHALNQNLHKTQKVDIPVICIGNLVAGGAGKTVTALSIMNLIKKGGFRQSPHFLTRGYGGSQKGAFLVGRGHKYKQCGDEALLLAQMAPTVVSKNRIDGARFAAYNGAGLLIMDDGLQNPSIYKDIKIIVISGEMGFGNGRLLPAGPLRETLSAGLEKADAFVMIGKDKRSVANILPDKPIFHAAFTTEKKHLPPLDMPYIAFAGLGYPQKFFSYLRTLGYELKDTVTFADHYAYTAEDMINLRAKAKRLNTALITTEKDYMRLPDSLDFQISTLPVTLEWQEEHKLLNFLRTHLNP